MLSPLSVDQALDDILSWAPTGNLVGNGGPGLARPNEPTNLSINNGLDLSLTTYEGLNLSQNSHAPNDNVLNLTAPANATSASSNVLVTANPVEVGLNLSTQNGINLSRQMMGYGGGAYYQSDSFPTNGDSTYLSNGGNRNSPLNLELNQRSSPLNLTNVPRHDSAGQFYFDGCQLQQPNYNINEFTGDSYGQQHMAGFNNQPLQVSQQQARPQQQMNDSIQQQITLPAATTATSDSLRAGPSTGLLTEASGSSGATTSKIRLFCASCNNQEFNTTAELNKHMEVHNNEVNYYSGAAGGGNDVSYAAITVTSCVYCSQEFSDEAALLAHQKTHHPWADQIETGLHTYDLSEPPSANAIPTVGFGSSAPSCSTATAVPKQSSSIHSGANNNSGSKKSEEAAGKSFQCDLCSSKFTAQLSLRRHKERVHKTGATKFACSHCQKPFYDKHDLSRHEKTHTAPKSTMKTCQVCNKRLKKNHICKPVVKTDFPCQFCPAFLDNAVSLGYHHWKHTKDPKYIVSGAAVKAAAKKADEAKQSKVEEKGEPSKPDEATQSRALDESGPSPPDAHPVNAFSQVTSQPLCLQTSGFAKEIKPLNMQVTAAK